MTSMELSEHIQGSHVASSPSGNYLAFIWDGNLKICAANCPERCSDVTIRIASRDITSLKWNEGSNRIAIHSAQLIEVIDLDDASHRVRLDNGGAGFGRFLSADFVGATQLLVIWEFGRSKLWDVSTGKGVEFCDVKMTSDGPRWQIRPGYATQRTLAMLSRQGANDVLNVCLASTQKQLACVRLSTADAQAISWSPDSRWLAVLDVPTSTLSVHFYTPDGHLYRSYPSTGESDADVLGTKAVIWSEDSQTVGLTRFDGRIILLNTRTFTPLAILEHAITIDQRSLAPEQQASVWQEAVSASGERSYTSSPQPVTPPLSKTTSSSEPSGLGVAEARFSCDGVYLASRDERMLNTVWIWNVAVLTAHAVIIQHRNIRKMNWHPTRSDLLMLDCGEGIAYLFQASSAEAPLPLRTSAPGSAAFSWLHTRQDAKSIVKAATKASFRLIYPEGQPEAVNHAANSENTTEGADDSFDEGMSEDSLFDVLSGRKPLPPKTEQSYTERIDLEVETEEEDVTERMDDTFRNIKTHKPLPADPFDDSEIF